MRATSSNFSKKCSPVSAYALLQPVRHVLIIYSIYHAPIVTMWGGEWPTTARNFNPYRDPAYHYPWHTSDAELVSRLVRNGDGDANASWLVYTQIFACRQMSCFTIVTGSISNFRSTLLHLEYWNAVSTWLWKWCFRSLTCFKATVPHWVKAASK